MRLLNKDTLDFELFLDRDIPGYLILSHQWRGVETTFQEFEQQKRLNERKWSPGTAKVIRFCNFVKDRPEQYIWVDTCCIDKTSSSELQEAINSMFRWYLFAIRCYVHLDDVVKETPTLSSWEQMAPIISQSRWFTRGWTLQELIAPVDMVFLDANWHLIGPRDQLALLLEHITGIDRTCFGNRKRLYETPVAKRMSWMSKRETSRTEDLAYCLLGIFNINMTMLYGEDQGAFIRLQKEIIAQIDDESIFLWRDSWNLIADPRRTVLARDPSQFSHCRHITIEIDRKFDREPCQVTTRGLQIETYGTKLSRFDEELSLILNCTVEGKRACMKLRKVDLHGFDEWERRHTGELDYLEEEQYCVPPVPWQTFQAQRPTQVSHVSSDLKLTGTKFNFRIMRDYDQEKISWKIYVVQ